MDENQANVPDVSDHTSCSELILCNVTIYAFVFFSSSCGTVVHFRVRHDLVEIFERHETILV
jgi:hypothetical protein